MSESVSDRPDDRKIDLGTAMSWPLAGAAIGLGLLALSALAGLVLLVGPGPAPQKEQALAGNEQALPTQPAPRPIARKPRSPARVSLPLPKMLEVVATKPAVPTLERVRAPTLVTRSVPERVARPAALVAVAPLPATPLPPSFKRRYPFAESYLMELLNREAREVDLDTEKGSTLKLVNEAREALKKAQSSTARNDRDKNTPRPPLSQAVLALLARRDDLKGLPVRQQPDCQASPNEAGSMDKLSRAVREETAPARPRRTTSSLSGQSLSEAVQREEALLRFLEPGRTGKRQAENLLQDEKSAVRILMQMLQTESLFVQRQLVKTLSGFKDKSASVALAQRAVFDLDPEIRELAVKALADRPSQDYRSVLLEALRYPWAPVADHAAEALVALKAQDSVFDLALLLDRPDPRTPTQNKDKKWVVPELVRINHLANCLLCHAPSLNGTEPLTGLVPGRGQPLPVRYYDGQERGVFARADITYLKQDFSVSQSVAEPGPWPRWQRFDYLIRQRELSAAEVARLPRTSAGKTTSPNSYPQREAVLWALRELTGEDAGDGSADWVLFLLERGWELGTD